MGLSFSNKIASWIYLVVILLIGVFIYQDYGLSWDETTQRSIGYHAYRYAFENNNYYLQFVDNVYGVGFELPLVLLEKGLRLTDYRDIFIFRHLVNILFFSFACFIFFRLNIKLFKSIQVAIFPTLMLILMPRIFGHAFFNSKDIPFLSMYIFCFYALYNYLQKPKFKQLVIMSVLAGWLINFRVMGILFFGSVILVIVLQAIQQKKIKQLWHTVFFIVIAVSCLISAWPYLWIDPLGNFKNAFVVMSKYRWSGTYLLNGVVYHEGEHVGRYLFRWIGITVPVLYLIVGFLGTIFFLIKNILIPKKIFDEPFKLMGWIFLGHVLAPIIAVIYFNSVLYDDWRQLYFIYVPFLFFAGYFFLIIFENKSGWFKFIAAGTAGYFIFILVQMVQLHPYQHVYFNELVSHKNNFLQEHYDQDYWGTSFYDGLNWVLKNDTSKTIPVMFQHDALTRNQWMLPIADRGRLNFHPSNETGVENSIYYLTNFRFDYTDTIGKNHFNQVVYEIKRQNSVILRIWKK